MYIHPFFLFTKLSYLPKLTSKRHGFDNLPKHSITSKTVLLNTEVAPTQTRSHSNSRLSLAINNKSGS